MNARLTTSDFIQRAVVSFGTILNREVHDQIYALEDHSGS